MGYSAKVDLRLIVGGTPLRLGHVGHDQLSIREECKLPPGSRGILSISVDGHERRSEVILTDGANVPPGGDGKFVRFEEADAH